MTGRPYRRILTPQQDAEICRRYQEEPTTTRKSPAQEFGGSEMPIALALKRGGVERRSGAFENKFSKNEEQLICRRYLADEAVATMAAEYEVTPHAIRRLLKRNDIPARPRSEIGTKYRCDHSFFDSIDSEEKVYWMRFFGADANVRDNSVIQIGLAPVDREHLIRLKYSLKSTHPVTDYSRNSKYHDRDTATSVLSITFARLTRGLATNGIGPRKTFTLCWLSHLRADLLRHYLRGAVDGDGSFSKVIIPTR